jgi:tetratricopeptide (TPR) repeat protein
VYNDLAQYDRAIEDFKRAIKINPADPNAFQNRARAYLNTGKRNLALEDYDKAIELNPRSAVAFVGRSDAHKAGGQQELALKDLDRALALNPSDPSALQMRATIVSQNHNIAQPVQAIEVAGAPITESNRESRTVNVTRRDE